MKKRISGIIFAAAFTVNACTAATASAPPKMDIREVIHSPDVVLADVRVPEQYAQGTAKNAINIPLAEMQNKAASLKSKKVVVFCNKGIQADQAVEILKKNGVEVYDGTSLYNVKAIQDERSDVN